MNQCSFGGVSANAAYPLEPTSPHPLRGGGAAGDADVVEEEAPQRLIDGGGHPVARVVGRGEVAAMPPRFWGGALLGLGLCVSPPPPPPAQDLATQRIFREIISMGGRILSRQKNTGEKNSRGKCD